MFSTCIFCHGGLGANAAIEHFPVGRRLAFDGGKGRLWAVCPSCERWNLSPIDERWEAIEECERLFRGTKLRVSTENMALARVAEGTTLVRIGNPQRPEMAAWRYGDQFHRRRRKDALLVSAVVATVGGLFVGGLVMGAAGASAFQIPQLLFHLRRRRTVARLPVNGRVVPIIQEEIQRLKLLPDGNGGFALKFHESRRSFRRTSPVVVISGDEATRAARHLLPRINRTGGSKRDVDSAVRQLEESPRQKLIDQCGQLPKWGDRSEPVPLASLPVPARLALEMSLHEEDERRALEGELHLLQERWREAEEVAAISDDMFLPPAIHTMLKKLKADSPNASSPASSSRQREILK